jgi:uncharacterized protein YecT (DUF1311 family)
MKFRSAMLFLSLVIPTLSNAASFDCAKASKPLEKLICASPELDAADAKMGEIYKQVNASFPLKGFVPITQRMFVSNYNSCMFDGRTGKPQTDAAAVSRCVKYVTDRSNELQTYLQAKVYSDSTGKFDYEHLAILNYSANGKNMVQLWGNWMPDAYNPKPFPAGIVCDINAELKPTKGGYKTDQTDETIIQITEGSVKLSEGIMCSPRTSIGGGEYKRVK